MRRFNTTGPCFPDEHYMLPALDRLPGVRELVAGGGGRINREMAVGTGRLDLCVEFRGGRYAIEVKTSANFQGEKSYAQCAKYLDSLGLSEGWMPIFEKSKEKSWEERIYSRDEVVDGKTIHVLGL